MCIAHVHVHYTHVFCAGTLTLSLMYSYTLYYSMVYGQYLFLGNISFSFVLHSFFIVPCIMKLSSCNNKVQIKLILHFYYMYSVYFLMQIHIDGYLKLDLYSAWSMLCDQSSLPNGVFGVNGIFLWRLLSNKTQTSLDASFK